MRGLQATSLAGLPAASHLADAGGAGLLEAARQRRAVHAAETVSRLARPRVILAGSSIAFAGAALVGAYGLLLSQAGVHVSTLALLAVLAAATLSSIAGFAFSAICGVMLLQLMSNPVQVVEIMMVCSIAIQSLSVAVLWRGIDWKRLLPFLLGGAFGVPFGVAILLHLGGGGFRGALGVLLIGYAGYTLFRRPLKRVVGGGLADVAIGFTSGITGGLAGFPGATVTMWCGMKGWDRQRQRGIYQPFILIMQVLGLGVIELMRSPTSAGYALDVVPLMFVPAALLGTWFGLSIFRRISDRSFTVTVNALLLVSGFGLLV